MNKDQRLVTLTQKVISINSENPPGNESALARFIEKDMRSLGLEVKTYAFAKGRPNVIATLKGAMPRRKAAAEALLITPHIDTVPIGSGWKHDPLGGKIVGGKLYGRGASDDKGNLASCMELMRRLVESKVPFQKDIIMAATADEECGSHYGIIPLLDKKILKPAYALVMDSDEFDAIIAQKGLVHMRVQVSGKKAHGAYNWRGVNAIELAGRMIARLKAMKFNYKKHKLLHPPTVNIGVIRGGDKVNMVADFCEFAVDLRFLPGMDEKKIIKEVKTELSKVTKKYKVIIDDLQLPYEIDAKHPFVQSYVKSFRKAGCRVHFKGSQGATVMTFFQKHKIPAFATGFGAHDTAHTTDEYLFVDTLCRGTGALESFVREFDRL